MVCSQRVVFTDLFQLGSGSGKRGRFGGDMRRPLGSTPPRAILAPSGEAVASKPLTFAIPHELAEYCRCSHPCHYIMPHSDVRVTDLTNPFFFALGESLDWAFPASTLGLSSVDVIDFSASTRLN